MDVDEVQLYAVKLRRSMEMTLFPRFDWNKIVIFEITADGDSSAVESLTEDI